MTTAELFATGMSRTQMRTLIRRGDLIAVGRGVYATAYLIDKLAALSNKKVLIQSVAALATASPGTVLSHHTAAQLRGLELLNQPPVFIATTRPPGVGSRSGKAGVHVHVAGLPPEHVGGLFGLPVTTAARTVTDLARASSFREGVVVADSALRQKLTSKKDLLTVLCACRRWPGFRIASHVLEFANGLSESVLESISRVAFRDLGLPAPELQVRIGEVEFIGRVDFLWKEHWTIAEADGALKYDDRNRAILQLRRDAKLRDVGFEVVHFNWQEINEMPAQVAAAIRAAFRRGDRNH